MNEPDVCLADPVLWLPESFLTQATKDRDEYERLRRTPAPYVRLLEHWEKLAKLVIECIEDGDARNAGVAAREMATLVYDQKLDRNICEHTGYAYFHACDHENCC